MWVFFVVVVFFASRDVADSANARMLPVRLCSVCSDLCACMCVCVCVMEAENILCLALLCHSLSLSLSVSLHLSLSLCFQSGELYLAVALVGGGACHNGDLGTQSSFN